MACSSKTKCNTLSRGTLGYRALLKIREELTCPICLDVLTDPRILPCHHSFCLECLQKMVVIGQLILNCPNCKMPYNLDINSVVDLPADFKANSLLEIIVATPEPLTESEPSDPENGQLEIKSILQNEENTFLAQVTCTICDHIYSIPRKLNCDHTFCMKCLASLIILYYESLDEISCPVCDTTTYVDSDHLHLLPLDSEKYGIMLAILKAVDDHFGPELFSEIPESFQDILTLGFVKGQNTVKDAEKMALLLNTILADEDEDKVSALADLECDSPNVDNTDSSSDCCKCC